jgi:RHS repeat-associated protein
VRNHLTYSAFGELTSQSDPSVATQFGYTGREFEPATGVQYNRGRFYAPFTGKFLSPDPIGFSGGDPNLYRYVRNNPQSYTDPLGTLTVIPFIPRPEPDPDGFVTTFRESFLLGIASIRYQFDWAAWKILNHWLFGEGKPIRIKDSFTWTEYMTADNADTRGNGEEFPFLKTVQGKLKQIAEEMPLNTTKNIYPIIRSIELRDGYTTGYGLLHGPSRGFHVQGLATKKGTTCNDFQVNFDLRYSWADDIDPNYKSTTPGKEQFYVNIGKFISAIEGLTAPKDYQIDIGWDAKSLYSRRKGTKFNYVEGWPFAQKID